MSPNEPNGQCGVNKRLRGVTTASQRCTDAYGGATALEAHHCATKKAGTRASVDRHTNFEQFWL